MPNPKAKVNIPVDLFRLIDQGVTKEILAQELLRLGNKQRVENRYLAPYGIDVLRELYDQWDRYAPGKDELRKVEVFLPAHEMEVLMKVMSEKADGTLQQYLTNAAHAVYMNATTAEEREAVYEDRRLSSIYFNMERPTSLLRYRISGEVQYLKSRHMLTPYAYNLELVQECARHKCVLADSTLEDELCRMETVSAEQYGIALKLGIADEPTSVIVALDLDAKIFAYAYPGEGVMRAFDLMQTVDVARQVYLNHQGLQDRNRIFLKELRERGLQAKQDGLKGHAE